MVADLNAPRPVPGPKISLDAPKPSRFREGLGLAEDVEDVCDSRWCWLLLVMPGAGRFQSMASLSMLGGTAVNWTDRLVRVSLFDLLAPAAPRTIDLKDSE